MRYLYISLLAALAFTGCKKVDITYSCPLDPTLVLAPEGYNFAQWDTIEIRTYNPSGTQVIDSGTYYPNDLKDVITITPSKAYSPNVTITIPATGDVHLLTDVLVTEATETVREDKDPPQCFNNVSYTINGATNAHKGESVVTIALKKP